MPIPVDRWVVFSGLDIETYVKWVILELDEHVPITKKRIYSGNDDGVDEEDNLTL